MAYIPLRPIVADDPRAYFAALIVRPADAARAVATSSALRALDQMYAYYSAA